MDNLINRLRCNHSVGSWATADDQRAEAADAIVKVMRERDELNKMCLFHETTEMMLIKQRDELLAAMKEAVECGMVPVSSASEGGAVCYSIQVQVADKIRAAIARATQSTTKEQ